MCIKKTLYSAILYDLDHKYLSETNIYLKNKINTVMMESSKLCLNTFVGSSAHLTYFVHKKSSHKNQISKHRSKHMFCNKPRCYKT